jgi:hypothetical protein
MKKLFIIFAIICLAAPVMAADWSFYGNSRMQTWRDSNDIGPDGDQADDDDTTWSQQGNSRIGANVKVNDEIGGRFEYGTGVNLRHLYGTYTMGNGSQLLIGQTEPPSSIFYSNSVYGADGDFLGVGQFYVGRKPMIQWSMNSLKVALIQPLTSLDYYDAVADDVLEYDGDVDVDLPKLEVSYQFKTDMFFVDVFGGYQTYTLDADTGEDEDVDSYVIGVGGGVTFGAVYFNAGVHMGQNLGNYGAAGFLAPYNGDADMFATNNAAIDADGDLVDSDALGYLAVIGFKASDMITFEAGYGYESYEWDVDDSEDANATQYYLNATINIAPGFFIVPEIGKVDYEAFDEDYGDFVYYGAKWQINF